MMARGLQHAPSPDYSCSDGYDAVLRDVKRGDSLGMLGVPTVERRQS